MSGFSIDAKTVSFSSDIAEFQSEALARGWGDGLPLIPPTPDRVEAMVRGSDRDPSEILASMPPTHFDCTVANVAINAVMAGCLPAHLPVLIAAVEAISDPTFNLLTVQATTHPCTPMIMVNGPIRAYAGLHGGAGAFGPGFRANATIGRALRLILQHVGGAIAGETDQATQGSPAKFSFCFAENEEESPWEPYHVSRGFDPHDSVVTVHAAEAPNEINDHVSRDARGVLFTFAQTIASMGKNNSYSPYSNYFVGFCPEHARTVADAGLSREDVQRYLYERARISWKTWRQGGMFGMLPEQPGWRWLASADDEALVPMSRSPEGVHVFVVGGAGRHSAWMPSVSSTRAVSRRVTAIAGAPWRPPEAARTKE